MQLNDKIVQALDTLEALYFFTQSLEVHQDRIETIRHRFRELARRGRQGLLKELRVEIEDIREQSGAIATNSFFRDLLAKARSQAQHGRVYLPKFAIDRQLFRRYEKVLPRWPYVKHHALVVFDPQSARRMNQLFELEGALFRDVRFLLGHARAAHKGIEDFRKRTEHDQHSLHSCMRALVTVIFHFLEAYLNGLAFDCLLVHHDELSRTDHDLLQEWDSEKQRSRFVPFERKVFRYPVVAGKASGKTVDLSECKAAHFLTTEGKELRDALTHPSPYFDPKSRLQRKVSLIANLKLTTVERVFSAAEEYVVTVEKSLANEPEKTVPWIFREASSRS